MNKITSILLLMFALYTTSAQKTTTKQCQRYSYEQMRGEYCMDITDDRYHGTWHHVLTLNENRTFEIYHSPLGLMGESRRTGEYTIVGNQLQLDFQNENQFVKPIHDRDITVFHFYDKWSKESLPVILHVFSKQKENDVERLVLDGMDTIKGEFDSILCRSLKDSVVIPSEYAGYDISVFLFENNKPENIISCTKPVWRIRSKNKITNPYHPNRYRVFKRKKQE